jgi:hypothetical protein
LKGLIFENHGVINIAVFVEYGKYRFEGSFILTSRGRGEK